MIGLFLEAAGQDTFIVQWKPPGRYCWFYAHTNQRDNIHCSSSYAEIDPNIYCNARASMNAGIEYDYMQSQFYKITFPIF